MEGEPNIQNVTVQDWNIADHYAVTCSVVLSAETVKPKIIHTRKYKRVNLCAFSADLLNKLPSMLCENVEQSVIAYDNALCDIVDTHAPLVTMKPKGKSTKPWYNDKIHDARKIRRQLERKWIKSGLEINRQMYLNQRNSVVVMIDLAKADYYKNKLAQTDPADMFKVIKELFNPSENVLPEHTSDKELAKLFETFFTNKISQIRNSLTSEVNPVSRSLLSSCVSFSEFLPVSNEIVHSILKSSQRNHVFSILGQLNYSIRTLT